VSAPAWERSAGGAAPVGWTPACGEGGKTVPEGGLAWGMVGPLEMDVDYG